MRKRAVELRRVLKPTGSFYLHCDWHASHYLKVMLDGVFGEKHFQNEIAWCYNIGGKSRKRWARKHDSILFYTKTSNWFFDGKAVGIPRETGDKSFGGKMGVDADGRRYQDKLDRKSGKYYRYYLDEPKIPEDWWIINSLQSQSRERLGYPTQKPEALLQRIIGASSQKGDVVLDPFCGCGTTISVAQQMQRQWIGIDISLTAAEIMKARVEKVGATDVEIVNEPRTELELRWLKPFEFQNWVIRKVDGLHSPKKSGDMGIDGFTPIDQLPIQVKRSSRVTRPVVDTFETAVERYGAKKEYIVAFSFTRGAYEEAVRVKAAKGLEIELITAEDLLLGTSHLVGAKLNREVIELPLEEKEIPKAPPKEIRPSMEELVESDLNSEEVA